jgi:hypothetical protein
METPRDATDAMEIILEWIRAAADVSFRHEGRRCMELFHSRNFDRFHVVFSQEMWARSRDMLKGAATKHGILTTDYTRQGDPDATEADLNAFIRAGKEVRDSCHATMVAQHVKRGTDPEPDSEGTIRGMWCSWPS